MRGVVSARKSASVLLVGLVATSLSIFGSLPASADPVDQPLEVVLAEVDVSDVAATASNRALAVELTEEVLSAPDQTVALGELSEHELEVFAAYTVPAFSSESTMVRRELPVSGGVSQRSALLAAETAVSCWTATSTRYTYSANSNQLYSVTLKSRWCGTGSVTNASSPSLVSSSGQTYFVGWSHLGRIAYGNGVVGGSARTWVQHKFQLGAAGIVLQEMNPCRRHVGFGNGSAANQDICGVA
jgi:hypothetical protein